MFSTIFNDNETRKWRGIGLLCIAVVCVLTITGCARSADEYDVENLHTTQADASFHTQYPDTVGILYEAETEYVAVAPVESSDISTVAQTQTPSRPVREDLGDGITISWSDPWPVVIVDGNRHYAFTTEWSSASGISVHADGRVSIGGINGINLLGQSALDNSNINIDGVSFRNIREAMASEAGGSVWLAFPYVEGIWFSRPGAMLNRAVPVLFDDWLYETKGVTDADTAIIDDLLYQSYLSDDNVSLFIFVHSGRASVAKMQELLVLAEADGRDGAFSTLMQRVADLYMTRQDR